MWNGEMILLFTRDFTTLLGIFRTRYRSPRFPVLEHNWKIQGPVMLGLLHRVTDKSISASTVSCVPLIPPNGSLQTPSMLQVAAEMPPKYAKTPESYGQGYRAI